VRKNTSKKENSTREPAGIESGGSNTGKGTGRGKTEPYWFRGLGKKGIFGFSRASGPEDSTIGCQESPAVQMTRKRAIKSRWGKYALFKNYKIKRRSEDQNQEYHLGARGEQNAPLQTPVSKKWGLQVLRCGPKESTAKGTPRYAEKRNATQRLPKEK